MNGDSMQRQVHGVEGSHVHAWAQRQNWLLRELSERTGLALEIEGVAGSAERIRALLLTLLVNTLERVWHDVCYALCVGSGA
ncbi:hypothetical protein HETIRDRAFT_446844 [Heterobasidion irregulare TC 32-1]|uniref:Uncharacterized protein n=1 Tax=Heterobasidion irregulare (strain TC 32-1) TaxID=747525 RepID=W4JRT3_HETIT|nr:uncharacterized protein HETIRDRAFT_446844 [Heterobasidion irregulare TC 32-1]ETW76272.1 hypothetical protein HETIRDRAFT_446844 [Heterobasidion irregulare TC 32-1]